MTNDADTVTIRTITYRIERETDPTDTDTTPSRQLGWLHGPGGSLSMIVRTQPTGMIVAHGMRGTRVNRLPIREVHDALTPHFA